jgi:hypothetical protein
MECNQITTSLTKTQYEIGGMIRHLFQSELANFASTTKDIDEKTSIDKVMGH